ncbi:unnamed protein product [Microthlaspi erraticum]|uniref:Uncharacterized protein n=1 Tax=Microthlaspi erraticum TaxID=1685480 RepID=A0A6D2JKG4_9BRAS|nr:unnamed protein product [Microthlaspi erraticum]
MVTGISRVYNNQEFELVVSKLTVLFTAIMTILMVFFGTYGKSILLNDEKKKMVQASGLFGIGCSLSSVVDAMIRPKNPDFHLSGEIAIISAYGTICTLVYAIFEEDYGQLCIAVFVVGFLGCLVLPVAAMSGWVPPTPPTPPTPVLDPRLEEVMKRLGRPGDSNGTLHLATIFAILMKPEAPETTVLVQATITSSPELPPANPAENIHLVIQNQSTGSSGRGRGRAIKTAAASPGVLTRSQAKKRVNIV